jgi:hypothetical protein
VAAKSRRCQTLHKDPKAISFDYLASEIHCVDDEIVGWLEWRERRRRDRHPPHRAALTRQALIDKGLIDKIAKERAVMISRRGRHLHHQNRDQLFLGIDPKGRAIDALPINSPGDPGNGLRPA